MGIVAARWGDSSIIYIRSGPEITHLGMVCIDLLGIPPARRRAAVIATSRVMMRAASSVVAFGRRRQLDISATALGRVGSTTTSATSRASDSSPNRLFMS